MIPSWEYIAAFFDGEGGFTITYNESGNPRIRVSLTQVDRDPLDKIQHIVGGAVHFNKGQKNQQDWHRLDLTRCEECLSFLKGIQPFILRRKDRVTLAIAFYETLLPPGRPDLNDKEIMKKILLHDRIFQLFLDLSADECTKGRNTSRQKRRERSI